MTYKLQGYAGDGFRRAKTGAKSVGIHHYAGVAAVSCVTTADTMCRTQSTRHIHAWHPYGLATCSAAFAVRPTFFGASGVAARILAVTTIISNKEAEA